jgi:hypothetical protein
MTNFRQTDADPINTVVRDYLFVAGRNPENAEPGNPDGAWYDTRFYVEAQTRGGAYAHDKTFETHEEAVAFEAVVRKAFDAGIEMDLDHWRFDRIPYGCEGWDEQEIANEIDDARRDGEQHPQDR